MRTVKWNPFLSGLCVLLGGVLLWTGSARADVSSTNPAAILVFPKLVVDTTGVTGYGVTDTLVQITNTSPAPVNVRCFLVDANGHCSDGSGTVCDPAAAPGTSRNLCNPSSSYCKPGWNETDFAFQLSPNEPIGWLVGQGFADVPFGGSIVPAPEDPMQGELKCVEVDANGAPVDSNDLKGEATIESVMGYQTIDTRGYNAIGIQAIAGANNGDDTLVLGQEYNGCPNLLVLDSFFDDSIDPAYPAYNVRTHLTLVPCSEDFEFQAPLTTVVQYLVYNEFEQRFSTSRSVTCFSEQELSDIDTRPGASDDATSIWNVNVEGTLTGQTIIRGVADGSTTHGNGLLGVAEEFHGPGVGPGFTPYSSDAFSLVQRGARTQNDIITMPPAGAPGP